jgi:hypothetical protein
MVLKSGGKSTGFLLGGVMVVFGVVDWGGILWELSLDVLGGLRPMSGGRLFYLLIMRKMYILNFDGY